MVSNKSPPSVPALLRSMLTDPPDVPPTTLAVAWTGVQVRNTRPCASARSAKSIWTDMLAVSPRKDSNSIQEMSVVL
jgi:hypothetical protein